MDAIGHEMKGGSALHRDGRTERLCAEDPIVQRHAPEAHRTVQVLVDAGAVTIDGDSKCVDPKFRHARNSFRHPLGPASLASGLDGSDSSNQSTTLTDFASLGR